MTSHGSENCPIDLTEDECPPKRQRVIKGKKRDMKLLSKRLENLEGKMRNIEERNERMSNCYAKKEAVATFLDKCRDLESRLDSLESWLERVSQVFVNTTVDSGPSASDETNLVSSRDLTPPNELEEPHDVPNNLEVAHQEICEEESVDEPCNETDQPVCVGPAVSSAAAVLPAHLVRSPESCRSEQELFNLNADPVNSHFNRNEGDILNCNGDIEIEESFDLKPDPAWIKLPMLPSIKRELNLMRDDQGRVLMFLSCSLKRLSRNMPHFAAVAGVFLENQLHNEFTYISERKSKDLKIEAEIRAALFGIELIRGIFKETLGDVCIMVISKCVPLVQLMKAQKMTKVYPSINICSCCSKDCEHAATRWYSQEPLGVSHIDILPELMLSLRALQVHWCKIENISEEEKKTTDEYSDFVEACLNEFWRQKRKEKN